MGIFLPEGCLIDKQDNKKWLTSISAMEEAMIQGTILESRAVICDNNHNLIVDMGSYKGMIPREEGAVGIKEGVVKDIALISKVNKPVSYVITKITKDANGNSYPLLSRRKVQEDCQRNYIDRLAAGDVIVGRVTHLETFGAFVDVGCGLPSLLPIDAISVSRISHPKDRFTVGQLIRAVVRSRDTAGRLVLSHKELLGSWQENANMFSAGETVSGIVRSVESYGIFVELTPNLAGLAESKEGVQPGMQASVYIKNLIPDKMKVKLIIVDAFASNYPPAAHEYFSDADHIDHWVYSPDYCEKLVESVF